MNMRSKLAWSNAEARAHIARYDRMVRSIARRLSGFAAAGRVLDEDDLRAEGHVAVLEAIASYRGFGMSETSWVRRRVRQRMIDAIRRFDPRSRDEMRLIVKHASGQANDAEAEAARAVSARLIASMEARSRCDGESLGERLHDPRATPADEAAHANRQQARLLELVPKLPESERVALQLRLFGGASLKDVGERLGVSASRVCQLQMGAVRRLNRQLAAA